MFYLVGLGLGDHKDVTVKGLEIIKRSKRVFLEAYTSILTVGKEELVCTFSFTTLTVNIGVSTVCAFMIFDQITAYKGKVHDNTECNLSFVDIDICPPSTVLAFILLIYLNVFKFSPFFRRNSMDVKLF
jgi:hypothetical protein